MTETTNPESIWAGRNVTEYCVNGQKLSVTFHDGNWSAVQQEGWTKYVRADLYDALVEENAMLTESMDIVWLHGAEDMRTRLNPEALVRAALERAAKSIKDGMEDSEWFNPVWAIRALAADPEAVAQIIEAAKEAGE